MGDVRCELVFCPGSPAHFRLCCSFAPLLGLRHPTGGAACCCVQMRQSHLAVACSRGGQDLRSTCDRPFGHPLVKMLRQNPGLTAASLCFAVQNNMAAAEEVIEKAREDGTLEQQRAAFEAEVEQAEQEDREPWEAPTEAQQTARARRREVRI